jgi:hypothetical protein
MAVNKNTHGGPGRGQGRNPEGKQPKVRLIRLIQQETLDELERQRAERGLKTIGNVLDQDYQPKEVKQSTPEQPEDATENN